MKIQRYVAQDSKTAMALVRSELGPDAMILANRRMGDQVEVTAGIHIEEYVEQQATEPRDIAVAATESRLSSPPPANEIQLKALERELQQLRGMLESELGERQWRDASDGKAPLVALRQRLLRLGLSRQMSAEVMQSLDQRVIEQRLEAGWHQALQTLVKRLSSEGQQQTASLGSPVMDSAAVTAVFGTTGVGKTSSVAKLAGKDVQRLGIEHVGLISLDSYRMGAREQLASFADAVGIPLCCASDRLELSLAMRQLQGRRIYIDTTGMGQQDPRLLQQVSLINEIQQPVSKLLVLSAVAQPAQSQAVSALFTGDKSGVCVNGAIITKLDEALSLGGVLDVLMRNSLPLHSCSDGQRIPDDMQLADPAALVERAVALMDRDRSPGNLATAAGRQARAAIA